MVKPLWATAIATLAIATPALAWRPEGHKVVALIAMRHTTPEASAEARRLLAIDGAPDIAAIASWADDYRRSHLRTGPWHFVDIPLDAPGYDAARDCPRGACVVARITMFAAALADRSRPDVEREVALKFVVHLVGDVHQPLHDEDHADRPRPARRRRRGAAWRGCAGRSGRGRAAPAPRLPLPRSELAQGPAPAAEPVDQPVRPAGAAQQAQAQPARRTLQSEATASRHFSASIAIADANERRPEIIDLKGSLWGNERCQPPEGSWLIETVGKRHAGTLLDGREWREFPR